MSNQRRTGPEELASFVFEPGDEVVVMTVTIAGAEPVLAIAPNPVNFGNQTINTTSPVSSVTLSNTGTGNLLISSVTAPTAPFAQVGGTCGAAPITIHPFWGHLPGSSCHPWQWRELHH